MLVAIDIGGTFTDISAFDPGTGDSYHTKSLTTYEDFNVGILQCIDKLKLDFKSINLIKHGTTLVINALIQRNGAKVALVTTRGFRDLLEIGRGNRPLPFELGFRREPALVARDRRFEVSERIDALGEVRVPLSEEDLKTVAGQIESQAIDSVAVSFLNSYLDNAHEQRAVQILQGLLPGKYITSGTEASGEWYEYERTATAAANAYVGPVTAQYLTKLESALKEKGFLGSLLLMGSNGGVISPRRAIRMPVALVESGPIGGCIGTASLAKSIGCENAIAFDMGGTTAKCAVVENYDFAIESIYYIGGYERGFPIRAPIIDIVEIGAGGGSIAWLDGQKRLQVGPRSAGSSPGPVCYGLGGNKPTITDANLVLRRLDELHFLGGEMRLDRESAEEVLRESICSPLGYAAHELDRVASGVIRISVVKMADAIRQITVKRGKDPRDFVLVAYGGGGPLHAVDLARELQIPSVLIPNEPGSFSAAGMLQADLRVDTTRTYLRPLDEKHISHAVEQLRSMEEALIKTLNEESGAPASKKQWFVELRYVGQHHTLKVELDLLTSIEMLVSRFDAKYKASYGHANKGAALEIVGLTASVDGATKKPSHQRPHHAAHKKEPRWTSLVFSTVMGRKVETMVYDRYALELGEEVQGPALIQEYGSTTYLDIRDSIKVGPAGELCIKCDLTQ